MRYLFLIIIIICISIVGCKNRDSIVFKAPLSEIEDSIKVMNSLLNSYDEFSYYIDDANTLMIGTNEIGMVDSILHPNYRQDQIKFTNTDIQIFSIIYFLKGNEINSCFKHKDLGTIVYVYKPSDDWDEFEEIRYIALDDGKLDINSTQFKNSFIVLNSKGNLLLIAPIKKYK